MINKYVKNVWPVGQVVKTPPFHGGNMSSNLVRVITILKDGINGGLPKSGWRERSWKPSGGFCPRVGPNPTSSLIIAGWSSLVARRAHNPKVIGSNPIPAIWSLSVVVITPPCHGGDHRFESGRDRKWLDSSVGRAKDWSSLCRRFDSVSRHSGGLAKWLNAAVCKTALSEFGGSNPLASI